MRIATILLTQLTICCFCFNLKAQDIHLSHIHASPTILNPALTGLFNGGDIRFIANARSQWQTVTNAYKTIAGSMDMKLMNLRDRSIVGAGLQVYSDRAGDLGFSKTSAALSFSILKSLDQRGSSFVGFGMKAAYVSYGLDYTKMIGFDEEPLVLSGAPDRFGFLDVTAGISYAYTFDPFNSIYFGISAFHLNNPNTSFYNRLEGQENSDFYQYDRLYRKLVFHGGGNVRLAKYITALPSFIFMDQGPHREINFGSFIKFMKSASFKKSENAFYIGLWGRWYFEKDISGTDALIAAIRADIKKTSFTFSFDINVSSLSRASYALGGPELSIIHIIGLPNDRHRSSKVKCPVF
jgi:Bacteroidetes-specific putative membrane protein